jgi:hypothetical protein
MQPVHKGNTVDRVGPAVPSCPGNARLRLCLFASESIRRCHGVPSCVSSRIILLFVLYSVNCNYVFIQNLRFCFTLGKTYSSRFCFTLGKTYTSRFRYLHILMYCVFFVIIQRSDANSIAVNINFIVSNAYRENQILC